LALCVAVPLSADDQSVEAIRGRMLYVEHCARCHGPSGRGDGPDRRLFETPATDLVGSGVLEKNPDEALSPRILAGRRYRLEPHSVESLPTQRPGTEALVRFLRQLPAVRWLSADAGKRIYLSRCAGCHGWYGRPTDEAEGSSGDLGDVAYQSSLSDYDLGERARHRGGNRPPLAPPLSDAEAADVVAFLRLLSPGYELYQRYCVNCHGAHGSTDWLAIDDAYLRKLAPGELEERAWHMLRGAEPSMPHFEGILSAGDVRSILQYLRSLR
jgi:mono/diheme cytochrome c family protein